MKTTMSSGQQHQFPVSSPRRMPCKHWQQFPIRRTCLDCCDDFCDKCRYKLPSYNLEEKHLEYQHQKQFYDFLHTHPKTSICDSN